MKVDLDPRDLATELARALAAPAVGRFVRSGATDFVVADAHARLAGLAGPDLGRVKSTEQLLAQWGNELRLVDARGDGEDAIRAGWLGVAGAALATSAVAGGVVAPISPAEGDMLGAAMLSHAVGVLHLGAELAELWADPLGELELRRGHASELLRAAEIAITDTGTAAARAAWLWLELEEGAARAAAAATIVALTLAEPPHG